MDYCDSVLGYLLGVAFSILCCLPNVLPTISHRLYNEEDLRIYLKLTNLKANKTQCLGRPYRELYVQMGYCAYLGTCKVERCAGRAGAMRPGASNIRPSSFLIPLYSAYKYPPPAPCPRNQFHFLQLKNSLDRASLGDLKWISDARSMSSMPPRSPLS